jgi:hypothetical protein
LGTERAFADTDRNIACEPLINGRPLATPYIREDDFLPLESADMQAATLHLEEPIFRQFVSNVTLPWIGYFGRKAQAAYLLDRVFLAVDAEELDYERLEELFQLDKILQPFLGLVMEQVGGRWGVCCGANSFVIT